jgi:hypothetical protein
MRRGLRWLVGVAIVGACAYAGTLHATPASQFTGTTVALGRFGDIDVNLHTIPADIWRSRQETHGDWDLYVSRTSGSRAEPRAGTPIRGTASSS